MYVRLYSENNGKVLREGAAALICLCKNSFWQLENEFQRAERERGEQFGSHVRMVKGWAVVAALETKSRELL